MNETQGKNGCCRLCAVCGKHRAECRCGLPGVGTYDALADANGPRHAAWEWILAGLVAVTLVALILVAIAVIAMSVGCASTQPNVHAGDNAVIDQTTQVADALAKIESIAADVAAVSTKNNLAGEQITQTNLGMDSVSNWLSILVGPGSVLFYAVAIRPIRKRWFEEKLDADDVRRIVRETVIPQPLAVLETKKARRHPLRGGD